MFFFRSKSQERLGEFYTLVSALLSAGFPIIIHYASDKLPSVFYAGISAFIAGLFMLSLMIARGRLRELKTRQAWRPMLMVTLLIIIVPSLFIYSGTRLTSGINTSLLLSSEVLFAILISPWAGEKLTRSKLLGGFFMLLGTGLILYNGTLQLNWGDLLILVGAAFFPVGNVYAKKALSLVSPVTVLFVRSFFGGAFLLGLSAILFRETLPKETIISPEFWWLLLLNGILIFALSKIFWYEGLKRLEMSKATILVMSYPVFSLLLAVVMLREIPTLYQIAGFLITLAGMVVMTTHKKIDFVSSPLQ